MYPGPNVPRHGKSLYKPYSSWVFMGKLSPRIPRENNKYHGYTVRGTPNCPLIVSSHPSYEKRSVNLIKLKQIS